MDQTPDDPNIFQLIWTDLRLAPKWLYHKVKALFYAVAGADNGPYLHAYRPPEDIDAKVEQLNLRRRALAWEREGLRLWRTAIVLGVGGVPILFLLLVPEWTGDGIESVDPLLGACLVFAELFLLVALLFVRARVASIGAQLQILEYESVLISFNPDHEMRAANLFLKHQTELRQYYDQTLRQNKQSFVVGILCVGFGLTAIVVVATLLLVNSESATAEKFAVGGLGILSVLLTGFVARIYLRVYEGSAKALRSFHDRLVNTNDYHFANLVSSTIEPNHERMAALSALARAISAPRPATEAKD